MSENYPRRRSDISARVVVDETVVLDLGAAQIHQLNATASFIWDRCDGHYTVVEIAEKLTGSFDVDCETARQAVQATLRRLDELGLLAPPRG
jgi:Coenzyme PQQ synthesis protein D (PqqD)